MLSFAKSSRAVSRTPPVSARPVQAPRQAIRTPQKLMRAPCACGGTCPHCRGKTLATAKLQRKLSVNEPRDAFEQEADRVADQVMRMADPTARRDPIPKPIGSGKLQRRDPALRGLAGEPRDPATAPPIVHEVLRSPGQPLDPATRAFMEPRFGAEFGDVRVHTDQRAAAGASAVHASAFTVGRDIVFGDRQYSPGTADGQRLLAHELTHTLQQAGGSTPAVQRKLQVGAGLSMDTQGFTTTKSGDVYTCPAVVKHSVWNEMFTSLLHSERVFNIAGKTSAEVNSNLKKHMAARLGIIDFASKKKYTFAAGAGFKMNPAYWNVSATDWKLKPGADSQKAIEDLNVHPKEYAIACEAATLLTMVGGSKSDLKEDVAVAVDDWIPGDWGYIQNTKIPPGGTPGLEGENIIYVGKDKYWGHFGPGNEYKTFKEWFDQVASWNGEAKTKPIRRRPTAGLT